MNESEQQAVVSACLMAALADGDKVEKERQEIRRIAERIAGDDTSAAGFYRDALIGRVAPSDLAAALPSAEARQQAYEMAVCVCDADGMQSAAEKRFLAELRRSFGLAVGSSTEFSDRAETIAAQPLASTAPASDADVDLMITSNAILCAALEQLPQRLASMAIVPLQLRMVYKVGAKYGYSLDKGHIVDLLATAGVGVTSQVLDGFARQLVRGLVGKFSGSLLSGLAGRATSSAVAFGTTYALGHLAKRYYSDGRKLTSSQLRETFASFVDEARGLEARHADAIASRARSVNVAELASLVRSS